MLIVIIVVTSKTPCGLKLTLANGAFVAAGATGEIGEEALAATDCWGLVTVLRGVETLLVVVEVAAAGGLGLGCKKKGLVRE